MTSAIQIAKAGGGPPLSFAQQRLWFLAQVEEVGHAYRLRKMLQLTGRLDREALRQALNRIVTRHAVLRTTFALADGEPVQRIAGATEAQFQLVEHDLRSHTDAKAEVDRLVAEEAWAPLDLEAGPLIRCHLVRLDDTEHLLFITMHHIVSDGWSMGILAKELSALYSAFARGHADPLPELRLQYADYAVWQRSWVAGDGPRKQAEYWRSAMDGAPALLDLPADHARPDHQNYVGAFVGCVLDEQLASGLKELSRKHRTTLYMTLLAGWALLMARLSGQEDVVIGMPVANRAHHEIEDLIGFFVNTLPLRVDVSESPTVEKLLIRVKAQTFAAQSNQELPFEHIVNLLRPARSLAHSPLFQVMFAWQNNPTDGFDLADLDVRPFQSAPFAVAKFDLTLTLRQAGGRIVGGVEYATSLFEEATIERYLGYFRRLLEGMVEDSARPVNQLPIMEADERRQILFGLNRTAVEYRHEQSIHSLFEAQVRATPEAEAVVCGEESLSYLELDQKANHLVHHLRKAGVGPNVLVAIWLERGTEIPVALLGVLKAGGAYLPLDPTYPRERISFVLDDSKAAVVVTSCKFAEEFAAAEYQVICIDSVYGSIADESAEPVVSKTRPEDLAYVIYTSGSTGRPKGVEVPHRAVVNLLCSMQKSPGLTSADTFLAITSIAFDIAALELFLPLCVGARLVIGSNENAAALIESCGATAMQATPSAYRMLIEAGWHPNARMKLLCGGEELPRGLANQLMERSASLWNMYGPTETTIWSSTLLVAAGEGAVPIGRPIDNTQFYILDTAGEPVPIGVAGELFIAGAGVARGYRGRPELTAGRFVADPFVTDSDARMYRTGDLCRWLADGSVKFLGRNDFQVKLRGYRIEPGEIESLLEAHEAVREAFVIVREDTPGDKRLVAYYTTEVGIDPGTEALRRHMEAALPEYMVPGAYIRLAGIPLTANGKRNRKALPSPGLDAYASRTYEEPLGESEILLAGVWAEVLKLDRVGRHDNFFELGGHSLLAVTAVERMRVMGIETDARSLFVTPTIAGLAAAWTLTGSIAVPPNRIPSDCQRIEPEMLPLVDLTAEEIARIVATVPGGAANVQDIYPLAPLQEGILFHRHLNAQNDPYLLRTTLAFENRERLDAYLEAMQAVIDRHDILRTGLVWEGLSEPVQVVWRNARLRVTYGAALYEGRMDLSEAPLLQVSITEERENNRWLMMKQLHHVAGDHATLDVICEEIEAHLAGNAAALPQPQPFRNLVARARLGFSAPEHERYFRELLGDVTEPTAPFGLLNVRGDGGGIEKAQLKLDSRLAQRIREWARKLGVGAASLCHLAWTQVLALASGRDDVVFGTVLFGRMQGGAGGRMLGLVINTLPVRIRIGEESVGETARRVHGQLVELMWHEQASLSMAQRCSSVPPPAPLFSALLNYRHKKKKDPTVRAISAEERTNYPLVLSVDDLGAGFHLTVQTDALTGAKRVCDYMEAALASLVEALERTDTVPIRQLDVMPAWERQKLLIEWNRTQVAYPRDHCLHELFEQQVEHTPDTTAVVSAEASLSYVELNRRANRLAHYLLGMGVQPDDRIAIRSERGPEMIAALIGVLKAGGCYVPLDPAYPNDRLDYIIQDCGAKFVLALDGARQVWNQEPETNPPRPYGLTADHLAYVMYTSGSTGEPKGVMVTHRNVVRLVKNTNYVDFRPSTTIGHLSNVAFDASTFEIWGALLNGCRLAVIPRFDVLEPKEFARSVKELQVSTMFLTSALFNECMRDYADVFDGVEHVLVGGDVCDPASIRRAREQGHPRKLSNGYGPTETTTFAVCFPIEVAPAEGSVPIGRPIANTRTYILDEHGQPTPIGVMGELYIGGDGVARGYLNRAELTATRFLADPFAGGQSRMYKTGDMARWLADGNIEFLGRNDFQVKIRGFRIELGEIEARLEAHTDIREAVAMARQDSPGEKRLVAYYTLRNNTDPGAETLRTHMLAALPEYMVPSAFVRLEEIPLSPNGKRDRKALPEPGAEAVAARVYESPRDELESALAGIWADVLKLDRVSRDDNFFDLGGDSLLAVRMITRVQEVLGVEAGIVNLFLRPVLFDFARSVTTASHAKLPEIAPANRGELLQLSYAQQRLWFLAQMEGASQAYNVTFGASLRGELDYGAMRQALHRIVERHEALRTTFAVTEGELVQRVRSADEAQIDWLEHDLRNHPLAQREADRLLTEAARTPFNLEAGPVIRGRVIGTAEGEHLLLIVMHHIASDGWSMGIFVNELRDLYRAFVRGEADPLPPLGLQYADYAAWQREWIKGDILARQAEYWEKALAATPVVLDLPADHPRPARQDYSGAFAELVLDEELTRGLKNLSRRQNVTLYMMLLAAWAALLARLSGQDDVLIGAPVFNRGRSEIENLIGFFVNTLAVRADLSGSPTTVELLRRVKAQTLAAQQNREIPFERVVELVRPVRSLAHSPLFQVMFAWQNAPAGKLDLPDLEVKALQTAHRVSKFDLTLSLRDVGDRIAGGMEYATALFDQSTVERYLGYFRRLLEGMVREPAQLVERIEILDPAERKMLLHDWNLTGVQYPSQCVHEMFEIQVEKTPEAPAVTSEDESFTYRELNRRANELAHDLRRRGVLPDTCVAICLERSCEMLVAMLGVLKAGGAYVPLDPAYPAERLAYMLRDCGSTVVLTVERLKAALSRIALAADVISLDTPTSPEAGDLQTNPKHAGVGLTPEHLAYVIYTSGSTGEPKGVMVTHRGLSNYLHWAHDAYDPASSVVSSSFSFDGTVTSLYTPLLQGGTVRLVREREEIDGLCAQLQTNEGAGLVKISPMHLHALGQRVASANVPVSVDLFVIGGEALPPATVRLWREIQPDVQLVNEYGPTETVVGCVVYNIPRGIDLGRLVPIGRPIANTRVYILDRHGEPVPVGVTGELYIGGAGVARGYLGRSELTRERFVPERFVADPDARMYKTDDLCRWREDGNIEFLGRNDFQVKIRGFRIELGEIEAHLEGHAAVREAVVVAREDTPDDKRLVAYYSVADDHEVEGDLGLTLRAHLSTTLPDYMVPAAFVRLDQLPLTKSGKLDREALPSPSPDASASGRYEEPVGETEAELAEVWAEVLKVDRVGRHDNFFELGGHSLLAVRTITRVQEILSVEVAIADLFNYPVLSAFAARTLDLQLAQFDPGQLDALKYYA